VSPDGLYCWKQLYAVATELNQIGSIVRASAECEVDYPDAPLPELENNDTWAGNMNVKRTEAATYGVPLTHARGKRIEAEEDPYPYATPFHPNDELNEVIFGEKYYDRALCTNPELLKQSVLRAAERQNAYW